MATTKNEAVKDHTCAGDREFVCGLVQVIGNRIKLDINSEFLTVSESGFTGSIPLVSGDDAANIDKMMAAAGYFTQLAQDLRQAATSYQSQTPGSVTPVEVDAAPRNQQQQADHLKKIHAILEQLPEAEKSIYQGFGFSERAKMYKMVDYEADPVKMQEMIYAMIQDIAVKKSSQA